MSGTNVVRILISLGATFSSPGACMLISGEGARQSTIYSAEHMSITLLDQTHMVAFICAGHNCGKMSLTFEIMWYWWDCGSTDTSEHIAVSPLAIVRMQQWLLPIQVGQRQKVPKLSLLSWAPPVQLKATCFCAICFKAACIFAMCFDMLCIRHECACTRTRMHARTHTRAHTQKKSGTEVHKF
jgi:hypothetical protein